MAFQVSSSVHLPRIAIQFCVQCKWNLRAAYYAQELLQTFSNTIGEVALIPVTGGIFTVTVFHTAASSDNEEQDSKTTISADIRESLIWDRKSEGGFPETKELKNRVRNLIDPSKDMGHVDRALKKVQTKSSADSGAVSELPAHQSKHDSHKNPKATVEDCAECAEASKV